MNIYSITLVIRIKNIAKASFQLFILSNNVKKELNLSNVIYLSYQCDKYNFVSFQ